MKILSLKDTTYNSVWMVALGGELSEAKNRFSKKYNLSPDPIVDTPGRFGHFSTYMGFRGGLLWFRDLKPSSSFLAHETLHATYYFLNHWMDAPLNDHTEELYTYFQGWLIDSIEKRF